MIEFQDEYGEQIYQIDSNTFTHLPSSGDSVVLNDEDWVVKSRVFFPTQNAVLIVITQNLVKVQEKAGTDNRLTDVQRAIMGIDKRQGAIEKKGRALSEQLVSVRSHVNQSIQRENKRNEPR